MRNLCHFYSVTAHPCQYRHVLPTYTLQSGFQSVPPQHLTWQLYINTAYFHGVESEILSVNRSLRPSLKLSVSSLFVNIKVNFLKTYCYIYFDRSSTFISQNQTLPIILLICYLLSF